MFSSPRKYCLGINMDAQRVNLHCAWWSAHFSVDVFFFFPPRFCVWAPCFGGGSLKTHARARVHTQGWRFARMLAEEHFGTIEPPQGFQSAFTLTSRLYADPPRATARVYHKKWKIFRVKKRRHPSDVRLNYWFSSSTSIDTSEESCFSPFARATKTAVSSTTGVVLLLSDFFTSPDNWISAASAPRRRLSWKVGCAHLRCY